jgi:hypothetical protein
MALDTVAMLMEFSTSVWTARKLDKQVTDETTANKKASKNAARVNKNLLAGRVELERITHFVAESRMYFYRATRPWSDSGARLLPVSEYINVYDSMEVRREQFEKMVSDFITVYPTLITAQAMVLGDMFNRSEFPDPADIQSKFDFRVSYMPLPSSSDFRVAVADDAVRELREHYEQVYQERLEEVVRSNWMELKESLDHLVDRLGYEKIGDDMKPRAFRDSLVPNVLELCRKLKGFNLTNDPVLEDARRELENLMLNTTAQELRKEKSTREGVRDAAQEILDKFSWGK